WPVPFPEHANPVKTEESDGINTVSALWTAAAEASGWFWGVGPDRVPYAQPRPTTPMWRVGPGAASLGVADDEFATHLVGRYNAAIGGTATTVRGNADAAARWGRVEQVVDLTAR